MSDPTQHLKPSSPWTPLLCAVLIYLFGGFFIDIVLRQICNEGAGCIEDQNYFYAHQASIAFFWLSILMLCGTTSHHLMRRTKLSKPARLLGALALIPMWVALFVLCGRTLAWLIKPWLTNQ